MSDELVSFDEIKILNQRLNNALVKKADSDTFVTKTEAADYTQQILDAVSSETAAVKADTQQILDAVSNESAAIKNNSATYAQQILGNLLSKSEAAKYNRKIISAINKLSGGGDSFIDREVIVLEADSETSAAESFIKISGANVDARACDSFITIEGAGNGVLLGEGDNSVTFGAGSAQNTVWCGGNDTFIVNDYAGTNYIADYISDTTLIQTAANVTPNNFTQNSDTLLILPSDKSAPVVILDDFNSGTIPLKIGDADTSYAVKQRILLGSKIENNLNKQNITSSAQGDLIINYGAATSIDAGDDDNLIYNYGDNDSISAGDGDNLIYNYGTNNTIKADFDDIEVCANNSFTYVNPANNSAAVYQDNVDNNISRSYSSARVRNKGKNVTIPSAASSTIFNYDTDTTLYVNYASYSTFYGSNFYIKPYIRYDRQVTNYASNSTISTGNSGSTNYFNVYNAGDEVLIIPPGVRKDGGSYVGYATIMSYADNCTINTSNSSWHSIVASGNNNHLILTCHQNISAAVVSGSGNYIYAASTYWDGTNYVTLNKLNGQVNEDCTICGGSKTTITCNDASSHIYLPGSAVVVGSSANDTFYNANSTPCCAVSGSNLIANGYTFTNRVTSGTSYEMIDIGNGYYTIQAT